MAYPVNPMMLIQMIKNGQNPQQLLMSILGGQAGMNPISANLMNMIRQGNTSQIETFARNYFASQGKDFDAEFKAFKETYGLR